MRNPEPMQDPKWNYIVLAAATVFEGISFAIGMRAVFRQKGDKSVWNALHTSKDPSIFTVVAEDGAALMGLELSVLMPAIASTCRSWTARRRWRSACCWPG